MFEGIIVGAGIAGFFLLVVPWLAVSGRKKAMQAQAIAESLRDQVLALQRDLDAVREKLGIASVTPVAAVAKDLPVPSVAEPEPAGRTSALRGLLRTGAKPPALPETVDASFGNEANPQQDVQHAAKQESPKRDLEEVIGGRWAIWVGGLALALGSLFLVRYTIEAGVLGPVARVLMGGLFSLVLLAGGELLRRGKLLPRQLAGALPPEHAPLALTAAGTVGLFGAVYAAHALYALIPQTTAFIALAAIGIGAMAASTLHGQALAGLGVTASYATPLLLGGRTDTRWPLVIFLLVVTAAGLSVQRRLKAGWLGWAVILGVALWCALLIALQRPPALAEIGLIVGALVLFAGAYIALPKPRYALTPLGDPQPVVALFGLLAALGLAFAAHWGWPAAHAGAGLAAMVLVMALALQDGRAGVAAAAAGLLPLGMILLWPSDGGATPAHARIVAGALLVISEPPRAAATLLFFTASASLALAAMPLAAFLGRIAARSPLTVPGQTTLAVVGGLAAPLLVFVWALRNGGLAQNLPAATALAAVAAALAYATHLLLQRQEPDAELGAGGYGAGAALGLGLAIALALPGLWMAVGFAIAAAGAAWFNRRVPLPILRRAAAAFATTAVLRALSSPVLQAETAWPVLNTYLVAYALPAGLLAATAWLLAEGARDRNVKVAVATSGLMAAIWFAFTIRHAFHGRDLVDDYKIGLGESGLYILACLGAALGAFLLRGRVPEENAPQLRRFIARLNIGGLVLVVMLALLLANPWIDGKVSGLSVLDSTFIGFLLPAVALGALSYFGRTIPDWFGARLTTINRNLAILLGYLFALAQTRIAFVGMDRFARAYSSQAEQYAYSAVTLGFGVLLLVIGFRLGSRPTRLASAVFVTIAVLKVFLVDLSELEGLLRALSFIGLGVVLIGIGLAYQRLLSDRKPAQEPLQATPV